jgi:hypothetical protein
MFPLRRPCLFEVVKCQRANAKLYGNLADIFHLMVNTPGAMRCDSAVDTTLCLGAQGRAQNSDRPSQLLSYAFFFLPGFFSLPSSSSFPRYLVLSMLPSTKIVLFDEET